MKKYRFKPRDVYAEKITEENIDSLMEFISERLPDKMYCLLIRENGIDTAIETYHQDPDGRHIPSQRFEVGMMLGFSLEDYTFSAEHEGLFLSLFEEVTELEAEQWKVNDIIFALFADCSICEGKVINICKSITINESEDYNYKKENVEIRAEFYPKDRSSFQSSIFKTYAKTLDELVKKIVI